jgi:hypothetical protein
MPKPEKLPKDEKAEKVAKEHGPKQPDANVMRKLGKLREDLDFLATHLNVVLPSQEAETPEIPEAPEVPAA